MKPIIAILLYGLLLPGFATSVLAEPPGLGESPTNSSENSSELEAALDGFESTTTPESASDLDQALDGFGGLPSATFQITERATESKDPEALRITGELSFVSHYAIAHPSMAANQMDFSGLNQTRIAGKLTLEKTWQDWKAKTTLQGFYDPIYAFQGRSDYSQTVLDTYESEVELFDTYLQGEIAQGLDLKFGRQIEVWGTSDNIRVTDVINPLDNRQPGLVDIENLRLPVTMTKLSSYWQDWDFSILAIHEQRPPKEAALNGEFFPIQNLNTANAANFPEAETTSNWQTTLGLAAEGRFRGWDLSLYAAEVQDSRWHFSADKQSRQYGQIQMLGAAGNWVLSDFLLKAEVAVLNDLQYNTVTDQKSRLDSLIGFDYLSIPNWSFSLEIADRWIQDYETAMASFPDLVQAHNWQTAVRASRDFNHDLGRVTYLLTAFGSEAQEGGFHRLWLDYDWSDTQQISVGIIDYFGGTHPMWNLIQNNDRIFAEIKFKM